MLCVFSSVDSTPTTSTRVFYISVGVCCAVIFLVAIILAVLHLHSMKRVEVDDRWVVIYQSSGIWAEFYESLDLKRVCWVWLILFFKVWFTCFTHVYLLSWQLRSWSLNLCILEKIKSFSGFSSVEHHLMKFSCIMDLCNLVLKLVLFSYLLIHVKAAFWL